MVDVLVLLLVWLNAGRLGDDESGLIDDGGVVEVYDVLIVEEDFPEAMSPFDCSLEASVLKLALDRRRSSLKMDMLVMDVPDCQPRPNHLTGKMKCDSLLPDVYSR